ncbi:MAG TPA: hypothetical protein VHF25_10065, partial [Nitriliruptorales bacterium]|nr:hypothetical protein [Nitriliruptorales bacterium]
DGGEPQMRVEAARARDPRRVPRSLGWRRTATVVAALLLGGCAYTGEPQQPGFTEVLRLEGGDRLTQSFVPRGNPLGRLDLLVGTYGVAQPDGVLTLRLSGAGQVRRAVVGGADIADAAWLALTFPPVEGAARERFAATVGWEGSDPLALFLNPNDPYPDGELLGRDGDLAFRVGHHGRVGGAVDAGGRVATEFAGRLRDDRPFTVVWTLTLAAGGAWLVRSLWRAAASRHR